MEKEIFNNAGNKNYLKKTQENFLNRETLGGFLLIISTIVALFLSNTSLAELYYHCIEDTFVISLTQHFRIDLTVEEWINDGLMVIFFMVAGLEIKREILVGELSTWRKAMMPILAALGGMIVPALIFVAFNYGTENINGWGIPMATDIAYSLGILALISKRIPVQLKIFLTALAIADDLGAILVIAFFYSSNLNWTYLGAAAIILALLVLINRMGVKRLFSYIILGIALWLSFLDSGIHPTIAGVLFAMTIPVKPNISGHVFGKKAEKHLEKLKQSDSEGNGILADKEQQIALTSIRKYARQTHPPLLRLENALTGFNSYFIIPLFALANAGVKLDIGISSVLTDTAGLGVLLGLALGKVSGIFCFSWLSVKMGIAELSGEMKWKHIFGMGLIAGIGFTMSLFITNLAYTDGYLIKITKISILLASFISALLGLAFLTIAGKRHPKRI